MRPKPLLMSFRNTKGLTKAKFGYANKRLLSLHTHREETFLRSASKSLHKTFALLFVCPAELQFSGKLLHGQVRFSGRISFRMYRI